MDQKPDGVLKVEETNNSNKGYPIKSRRLLKSLKEKDSTFKFYGWDFAENYTYITYLSNFRSIFNSHEQRKRVKVFRHLAKLIKTRNPHQIKSHHQKMMLRHETVDNIISFLKAKISNEIENKPQFIPIIEKINTEAQIFFIKELGLVNMKQIQKAHRQKKEEERRRSEEMGQEGGVKIQQEREMYILGPVKEEARVSAAPEAPLVKDEQNEEMIWHSPQ